MVDARGNDGRLKTIHLGERVLASNRPVRHDDGGRFGDGRACRVDDAVARAQICLLHAEKVARGRSHRLARGRIVAHCLPLAVLVDALELEPSG